MRNTIGCLPSEKPEPHEVVAEPVAAPLPSVVVSKPKAPAPVLARPPTSKPATPVALSPPEGVLEIEEEDDLADILAQLNRVKE